MNESGELGPAIGRWTSLRVVVPQDFDFLYRLSLSDETLVRWRYRGSTPSPQQFQATLWEGVSAQFVIESASDRRPVGLAALYSMDHHGGTAFVATVVEPQMAGLGWPLEGL